MGCNFKAPSAHPDAYITVFIAHGAGGGLIIDSRVEGIGNESLHYLWSDNVVVFYIVYRSSQVEAQGQGKQQFMYPGAVRCCFFWGGELKGVFLNGKTHNTKY